MTTKVTNVYNLKLTPSQFGQNSIVVNCSQYDSLFRVIQFNLYNGNAVYSIPEGSVVTIRGTKKDNTGFEYECDYSNNVVTFPLQQQITIFPGKVPAELRITNNGEIIGSWNFLFLVEESPLTNDTIISETDLPLLESALQAAAEAENYKNLAQQSADNASASEQNASESEANALTYSQNAQTSANSASQSEANALTYSQNASASATEAQGYAQDAEDSATQSADSATSASQSATTAQQIADNIADLVDEAQGYASQSLTNAQNSAQSATQASQSATNASQSASNAQTYASNANTSAQNASSSATSAQTYASNASTSATQSASSATASAQSATNAQTYANNASASATQAQGYATNASDSATASADSATESQGYAQNASDSATEAQEAVDTIDEAIKNKADIDGVYPKLFAGDLVKSEVKDDVFTYQVTDHTGKANINSIKGNTINWNQLMEHGNFDTTAGFATSNLTSISVSDGVFSGTCNNAGDFNVYISRAIPTNTAHKILVAIDAKCSEANSIKLRWPYVSSASSVSANTWFRFAVIVTPNASYNTMVGVQMNGILDATYQFRNYMCIDLTAMFGAGNEPTSVAEFTKLFPLPYYSYESGKLLSFNGTGIKTTGKNKVFKIIEHANIGNDGRITVINDYSLAVAEITKGYTYRVWFDGMASGTTTILAGLYTEEPVIGSVAYDGQRYLGFPRTFTAEIDGYIVFRFDYGITEAQVELGTVTTDYEPYKEETLSLPIAEHFPNGMHGRENAYDELTKNKAVHRMQEVVFNGTEDWRADTSTGGNTIVEDEYPYYRFYKPSRNDDMARSLDYSKTMVATIPVAIGELQQTANIGNICIAGYNRPLNINQGQNWFYILALKTGSITNATELKAYLQANPITVYYELTTPTEEDVNLDLSYSTYEGGTEQLLPANTDVPVTSPISMNVEFDFGENLNARFTKVLNMIAPVENSQVSKAYSVGQYLIYDYVLYKVTSAIASGGTITVGTNVTATTLAEILEAL